MLLMTLRDFAPKILRISMSLPADFADAVFDTPRFELFLRRTAGELGAHFEISALFSFFGKCLVLRRPFPGFGRPFKCLCALLGFVDHGRVSIREDHVTV
jgi:hypothetical protein